MRIVEGSSLATIITFFVSVLQCTPLQNTDMYTMHGTCTNADVYMHGFCFKIKAILPQATRNLLFFYQYY
jgi:hypothetical protein